LSLSLSLSLSISPKRIQKPIRMIFKIYNIYPFSNMTHPTHANTVGFVIFNIATAKDT
jgi:hypothetical protein